MLDGLVNSRHGLQCRVGMEASVPGKAERVQLNWNPHKTLNKQTMLKEQLNLAGFRVDFARFWIGEGLFDILLYLIRVKSNRFQFEVEGKEARWKFAVWPGRDDDIGLI